VKIEKTNKIFNYIIAAILFSLWGSIFLIHGIVGAVALPILILLQAVQIAYPANINKVTPSITVRWPFNEKTT